MKFNITQRFAWWPSRLHHIGAFGWWFGLEKWIWLKRGNYLVGKFGQFFITDEAKRHLDQLEHNIATLQNLNLK